MCHVALKKKEDKDYKRSKITLHYKVSIRVPTLLATTSAIFLDNSIDNYSFYCFLSTPLNHSIANGQ